MNASLINDNLSYSVPTVVKTFETYAAFNSESPVSIPTD